MLFEMSGWAGEMTEERKRIISSCQLANFRAHCCSHAYMMSNIMVLLGTGFDHRSLHTRNAYRFSPALLPVLVLKNTVHCAAIASYSRPLKNQLINQSKPCRNRK